MSPPDPSGQQQYHEAHLRDPYAHTSGSWDGSFDEMETLLGNMQSGPLKAVANDLKVAADTLIHGSNTEILTVAGELAKVWKGPAAGEALAALKKVYDTSAAVVADADKNPTGLEQAARSLEKAFNDHGMNIDEAKEKKPKPDGIWEDVLFTGGSGAALGATVGTVAPGVGNVTGGVVGGLVGGVVGVAGGLWGNSHIDDGHARTFINDKLTPVTVTNNGKVPERMAVDPASVNTAATPPPLNIQNPPTGPGYIPTSRDPRLGSPKYPGADLTKYPHGDPTGHPKYPGADLTKHPGTDLPKHPAGDPKYPGADLTKYPGAVPNKGNDLASLPEGPPQANLTPFSGPHNLGPGLGSPHGDLGVTPGGPGAGPGTGLGTPGGGPSGGAPRGGLPGAAGNAMAAEEAAAARAATAGRNGMGGGFYPPMMGGGAGNEERERERTTWLTEDEDVWGGDDEATPPVIG